MKKYPLISLLFAMLLLFVAGCQADESYLKAEAPAQKLSDSEDSITIKTEKAQYPTSVKKIIVKIQNDSDSEFTTGTHVFLEKKVGDTWYQLPMKEDSFTEAAMLHRPGELSAMSVDIDDLKYTMTVGEYRATIGSLAAPFIIVK